MEPQGLPNDIQLYLPFSLIAENLQNESPLGLFSVSTAIQGEVGQGRYARSDFSQTVDTSFPVSKALVPNYWVWGPLGFREPKQVLVPVGDSVRIPLRKLWGSYSPPDSHTTRTSCTNSIVRCRHVTAKASGTFATSAQGRTFMLWRLECMNIRNLTSP